MAGQATRLGKTQGSKCSFSYGRKDDQLSPGHSGHEKWQEEKERIKVTEKEQQVKMEGNLRRKECRNSRKKVF